jgi:glycosyltransferase involved in cell wall biosynthesis
MMMSLVSIIITTYNRHKWLKTAIECALNQTYRPIEVIVVDDGSTPPVEQVYGESFPQVRFIFQTNQGPGNARNTALTASQGEFIQFLDDDDWLSPEAIEQKIARFRELPQVDAVYSDLFLADQAGNIQGEYYAAHVRPLPAGDIYQSLVPRNFIPIHAPLFRRSPLVRVGGFPERIGSEDWECLVKIAETSAFAFVDQPLGYYRLHDQNATFNFSRQIQGDACVQKYVSGSCRFSQTEPRFRARVLISYALQQWLYGDPDLSCSFIKMADDLVAHYPHTLLLKTLMLFGRQASQIMMSLLWQLRAQSKRFSSVGYYFLTRPQFRTASDNARTIDHHC